MKKLLLTSVAASLLAACSASQLKTFSTDLGVVTMELPALYSFINSVDTLVGQKVTPATVLATAQSFGLSLQQATNGLALMGVSSTSTAPVTVTAQTTASLDTVAANQASAQ